jgi:hypothetical protein
LGAVTAKMRDRRKSPTGKTIATANTTEPRLRTKPPPSGDGGYQELGYAMIIHHLAMVAIGFW